jgi:hypothetical protein
METRSNFPGLSHPDDLAIRSFGKRGITMTELEKTPDPEQPADEPQKDESPAEPEPFPNTQEVVEGITPLSEVSQDPDFLKESE